MSLTEEQKIEIAALVSEGIKAAAKSSSTTTPPAKEGALEAKTISQQIKEEIEAANKGSKSIVDEARDALEADKTNKASLAQVEESIKFNLSIKEFVERNKELLPEEAQKILPAVATKTFKDENERANTVRQSFLDSFLSQKENMEALTMPMRTRAEFYKALAESDKARRSSEFWELAETGVALKALARKADALNKINGVTSEGSSSNPLGDKILAAAAKKFQLNQK